MLAAAQILSRVHLYFAACYDKLSAKGKLPMLDLFVWDVASGGKVPAVANAATEQDLAATRDWQTSWETLFARDLPNKVALRRTDDAELLGLMSYELDEKGLAVEVIHMESARHSNANLLHAEGGPQRMTRFG